MGKHSLRKAVAENALNKKAGCNLKRLERSKHHPDFSADIRAVAPVGWEPEPELNEFGEEVDEI